jgi:hypothetical protein
MQQVRTISTQKLASVEKPIERFWNGANRWDEKAGLRRDALSSQVIDALEAHETRRPAMKEPSTKTVRRRGKL